MIGRMNQHGGEGPEIEKEGKDTERDRKGDKQERAS